MHSEILLHEDKEGKTTLTKRFGNNSDISDYIWVSACYYSPDLSSVDIIHSNIVYKKNIWEIFVSIIIYIKE
jgi:hypothetical protein